MSKKKVCVILPCYKVKTKIYKIYKKTVNKKIDCTIFVDDFCPEKSVSFLKSKIKKNKKTKFIFMKKNTGVGGATLAGFQLGEKMGFDILIKFDADNQHKVKDLLKLINLLKRENINFCKGYRDLTIKKSLKRKMPLIRIFGANMLTYISRFVASNYMLKDVTNGLFGMKSKILKQIDFKKIKKNYFFEQDLIFNLSKSKVKIHQFKSEVIYKDENSSLNVLGSIIPFSYYHIQNFFKR